ncbi:hypothetical protein HMPREF1869_01414 [Bacteroidales bacterium KA00251]|nr:hypothetical protein HMPREF1869_01414 [Bacteroidales bacterium KA00251]
MDLILVLAKHHYPPDNNDEVFKEIFEQAENFKKHISKRRSNLPILFSKSLGTFSKISRNISQNLSEHFSKTLGTFLKNSRNIYKGLFF